MTKYVLGIESSCDDTGVAIVSDQREILANIVVSQLKEHEPYKGVVPEIAARSHMNNIEGAIKQAFSQAGMTLGDIDAVAATTGPGLIGGVIVGTMLGKAIASSSKKPFIAVNHLEGHVLTPSLTSDITFPYLSLLVSGGHCQFIAAMEIGKYKIFGQTLDDAVGEAFDKTAKLLDLGFPGGPIIEKYAAKGDSKSYKLPLSMITQDGCDLSFSGLKTAVRRIVEKEEKITETFMQNICASFQYTIGEILSKRTLNAIEMFNKHITNSQKQQLKEGYDFILSGGVAANMYLRNILEEKITPLGWRLVAPPINLCTDNAAMIAWVGIQKLKLGQINDLDFCPKARWSIEEC